MDQEKQQQDETRAQSPAPEQETGAPPHPEEVQKAEFEQLKGESNNGSSQRKIEMLYDIVLPVAIELGRTKMYIKEILELERGSIIELDKLAGEPVDLYVNNKKMAEGEVVVVDKHFGIRITNLISPTDRLKGLGGE